MAPNKRPRQHTPYPKARQAAEAAAARRRRRRRVTTAGIVAVLALGAIAAAMIVSGGDDETDVATTTPTTAAASTVPVGSAAGKPCVPVADQLPQGAPPVPVQEGLPPAELVTQDLKPGTGAVVAPGATVTVNYIGVACSTGKIFDASYTRGQPATFPLGQVIKGWQDGIPGMRVGGQRLLGIPPAQAYGATGSPPRIGPDETLWFVVEVLETR